MKPNVFVFRLSLNGTFEAGQYRQVKKQDGTVTANLVCPDCQRGLQLGPMHVIDASGIVTPSFVCTHSGCKFHQMIRLEDWEP